MSQHDEDRELVAELCEFESGLTEWEVDFVDDIARVVDARPLSERQREEARQILDEKGEVTEEANGVISEAPFWPESQP